MRKLNWTTIALIGGLVVLVLLIAYFTTTRNPDQDKLTGNQVTQAQAPDVEKNCASKATYDAIKRELFRRAAEVRGSDQAAYDKLAAYAVVRMEDAVMESQDPNGGANCSGSLSLDLPPGVAAVGGRRSLMADIDYTVEPNGDVTLRNADAIITPLATLSRVAEAPPAPVETNQAAPTQPAPVPAPVPGPAPAPVPPPGTRGELAPTAPARPPVTAPRPAGARPSFDCAKARTKGEIAVCSDAGLAALDRNMAAQYARSVALASPEQRALLERTRTHFLRYRDRCPNRQCIGDAYVGRMREIRDIMQGTWRPPR